MHSTITNDVTNCCLKMWRIASMKPVPKRGYLTIVVFFALPLLAFQPAQGQTETVLYSFCSQPGCADGYNPFSALVMDKKRNLYGTTYQGGTNENGGNGTLFEILRLSSQRERSSKQTSQTARARC